MPVYSIQLVSGTRTWVTAELLSISGIGRRSPRLQMVFQLRTPGERINAEMHHVRLRVFGAEELLGETAIVGAAATWHGSNCSVEVPVTHPLMRYVTGCLAPNSDAFLKVKWEGILRVKWSPNDHDRQLQGDVPADEWTFVNITEVEMGMGIARSDWFGKVLQPIIDEEFVYLEVMVPRGIERASWDNALALLADAEKLFVLGDDPGVFAKLRGALDALPGAKQHIVDALPEPRRTAVNRLLRDVGQYLHNGRHIATEGDEAGTFPVNRIDADAAISIVRVLFSYLSRALFANEVAVK